MSTDTNNINIFLSLENPCTFFLAKENTWKRIFNSNSELSQNRTEKQIMPSKTTINWPFNDIWHYLFIACFDRKVGVFQQKVVRVYYILNFSWLAKQTKICFKRFLFLFGGSNSISHYKTKWSTLLQKNLKY